VAANLLDFILWLVSSGAAAGMPAPGRAFSLNKIITAVQPDEPDVMGHQQTDSTSEHEPGNKRKIPYKIIRRLGCHTECAL
jgi:hypothetical protein